MDLKIVGQVIAAVAPIAGSIIGDLIPLPIPGKGFIATKLLNLVAQQFGVPATPDAVATAVQGAPNEVALAKINAAMVEARAQIDGFAEIEKAYAAAMVEALKQTGETMRAEILPENRHWFFTGWRPFIGWVFGITALCFGVMLIVVTGHAAMLSPDPLKTLNDAWPLFLSYFGVLGVVVGVVVRGRSDEKMKSMETGVPVNPVAVKPKPK